MFDPFTHLKYYHTKVHFQIRNRDLVRDQTVISNRSCPSHLGNSWDANVPSASKGPENNARKKVSRRKADPNEAGVLETGRKKQLRRVKQWVSLGVDMRWVICIYSYTLRDLRDYISSMVQHVFKTWIPSLRPTKLSSCWINASTSGFCITWHHICYLLCHTSPPLNSDPLPLSHPLPQQTTW